MSYAPPKPTVCAHCGEEFHCKAAYKLHIRVADDCFRALRASAVAQVKAQAGTGEGLIDILNCEDLDHARVHRQPNPCRLCGRIWYMSDGALRLHQERRAKDRRWMFPNSCPNCRKASKAIARSVRGDGEVTTSAKEVCPPSRMRFDSKVAAEEYHRLNPPEFSSQPQHPYYCLQCQKYHLTSKRVATIGEIALASAVAKKQSMETRETQEKVRRLLNLGHSPEMISTESGMSPHLVTHYREQIAHKVIMVCFHYCEESILKTGADDRAKQERIFQHAKSAVRFLNKVTERAAVTQ